MGEQGGGLDDRMASAETRQSGIRWQGHREVRVPGLTLLAHPDPDRVGERVAFGSSSVAGKAHTLSRLEPLFAAPGGGRARPLEALHVSRKPLHFAAVRSGFELRPAGTTTAVEVDGEALHGPRAISHQDLDRGLVLMLAERIVLVLGWLDPTPPSTDGPAGAAPWIGDSLEMQRLHHRLRSVADLDVPVLIRGETGSGKELAAAGLHDLATSLPRGRSGPFVAVNMAAVPTSLAAAELFGNARGAFTGADRARRGYFREADGGTLFLDEAAETPEDVQTLLLRVLETGEVRPLGDKRSTAVDVRLVAATDADLEAAMAEGRFREPLYHRLAGIEVHVPPLRRRRDDFGRLFFHFLRRELRAMDRFDRLHQSADTSRPWLPAPLIARLARQSWPGNVRQLRNVVRELAISGRDADQVSPGPLVERLLADRREDSSAMIPDAPTSPQPASRPPRPRRTYRRIDTVSPDELSKAWREQRFSLKATARALGVSRTSLYALIDAHPTIRKASELTAGEIEGALEGCDGDLQRAASYLEVSIDGLRLRLDQLRTAPET